jgi:hypothetical protein
MTLQYACFVKRLCLVIYLIVVTSLGSGVSVAEGPKASVTVSSVEAKEKYKKNDRVTIEVYSDKYGCPFGTKRVLPRPMRVLNLTRDHWYETFNVPVGNNIYVSYQEQWHGMLVGQWCETTFRFTPKDGAHYMLRLTSKIRGLSAEGPFCVHTFHVMDGDREETVESYFRRGTGPWCPARVLFADSTWKGATTSGKGWMYTRSDNTIVGRLKNGDTDEGTWRISKEGWFCRTWKRWADGKEGCWQVELGGKYRYYKFTPKAGVARPYEIKILQGDDGLQYRLKH